jgi:hypothetical protein
MPLEILYWVGLAGAAAAIVIYFVQVAIFRNTVRLVSGAGLFFTGVGLAEAAIVMHSLSGDRALPGAIAVVALLIAVYFQSVSALRRRAARDDDARGQVGGTA